MAYLDKLQADMSYGYDEDVPKPQPQNTRTKSQIEEQLNLLDKALESIRCNLLDLENRLSPVMVPENPEESCPSQPPEMLVPLASELRAFANRSRSLSMGLEDIIGRLRL